jgi:hypothetical protein
MLRRIVPVLGGTLVLFHAWLLGSRVWAGQLAEPDFLLRWAVAAALVIALVGLRRSGGSMVWGRKAVSVWLLAALLHGPALAGRHTGLESPALPEAITVVLQIASASVMLGLGLALLAALAARHFSDRPARLRPAPIRSRHGSSTTAHHRFDPRPPPIRALVVEWEGAAHRGR